MKWIRLVGLLGAALPLVSQDLAHAQLGVSDDRVSLPEGPGSLEGIGENVDVAASMGQMSHGVPIEVPAGFAGLTPELALSYSSGNGSSAVGIGWDLMLPTIERMTWRGLPQYRTDDLFAVNGSEQLVEVEQRGGERVYRARFEHDFARYRWLDSGDGRGGYWIAEYPDGRVGYFGADQHGNEVDSARVTSSAGEVFRYHLVAVTDPFGHHIDYRYRLWDNQALIDRIEYVHDGGDRARFAVLFGYEARQDVLSDATAGFELVLAQRLVSIDVLSEATRIRRYELSYEPYEAAGGLSRLTGVELLGHLDERYPIRHVFGYSEALGGVCDGSDCARPFVVDMGTLPGGADIATGDVTLIDINGDALPDVLDTSQPGAHRFILNVLESEGRSRFDTRVITSAVGTQGSHRLRAATVQVLDVNGDGFSDLINSFTGEVLCNDASGDWSADGTGPTGAPCLADGSQSLQLQEDQPGDPEPRHVRFIDIDNDKYIDVVRTPDNSPDTQIFRNTGAGFVALESGVEPLGWVFDGDNLQLADMNGDGLLDVVQIDPDGGIHHRINVGFGAWGPIVDASGVSLQLSEIPLAQIEDINGDALADVVIAAGSELRYALNRNAGRFDDFVTITPAQIPDLPARGPQTTVVVADMNGNGTQDVVWIGSEASRGHVRYLELFPVRPNLLSRIENGIGSVQEIAYGTSVAQQARDRDIDQQAWKYRLPHAMNVVERVDTWATATGGEDGQGLHEVVEYRYRHGYYDSVEKRFRGFEHSEARLLSDASQEPGLTVSEFDVGVDDVYYNGLLRSQTVFSGSDDAARPLQTQRMEYGECTVAEVPAAGLAYPVRSICTTAQSTIVQEGAEPSEWATIRTEYEHDGYGNVIVTRNLGVVHRGPPEAPQACRPCDREASLFGEACGATCTGDEAFVEAEYIAPGAATGGRWILGRAYRERRYGIAGGETSELTTFYDGPDFVGLPAGQLDKGLVSRVEARVRADGNETVALVRNRHDHHGNVVETIDPNGSLERATVHRQIREYDGLGLNLRRTETLLEDEDGSPYRLRQELTYEPLFNRISESTATMRVVGGEAQSARNSKFFRYDAFGRLSRIIRPGDSDSAPGIEVAYQLGDPVSAIVTRQRSRAGGATDIEVVRCIDGRGRTLQDRTRLSDGSYQVSGFTEYNRLGAPVRMYEPYLDTSPACATRSPGDAVPSTRIRYDALSRDIETILADADSDGGASRQRTVFAPLATLHYDAEDNDPASPHFDTPVVQRMDGLGRIVAMERHLDGKGAPPTITSYYDGLGRLAGHRDPAGNVKLQEYDLLGRVVAVDDPNAGRITYEYDAAGNLIARRDTRGITTRVVYDGANRPLARWDESDPEGTRVRFRYDVPDVCPERRCTNAEGKPVEVLYPVDLGDGPTTGRDQFGFDARGRLVYEARVLFGHEFPLERTFDNVDRPVHTVFPDGQELRLSYDGDSRLLGIEGVIDQVTYDERGQIGQVRFHNGVTTEQRFDVRRRLAELITTDASGKVLQGYAYTRDRAGNLRAIRDLAEPRAGHASATAAFDYDAWYRLTSAETMAIVDGAGAAKAEMIEYRHDVIDNLLSATSSDGASSSAHAGDYEYHLDHPNAVVQIGNQSRGYDAAGYMIERAGSVMHWDHLGRLTRASATNGEILATFAYGGDQDRVAKREAGYTTYYAAPSFEVRDGISVLYARLGRQRVARLRSDALATVLLSDVAPLGGSGGARASAPDGQITAADAWVAHAVEAGIVDADVPAASEPAALLRSSVQRLLMEADGGPVYLHGDHLGSLTLATSNKGELAGERAYHLLGDVRSESGYVDEYGFTGQERDRSTGLVHFQARYLDPAAGRWISPDPLFEVSSSDLLQQLGDATTAYAYVSGNFTNAIDLEGLKTQTIYVHGTFAAYAAKLPRGYAVLGGRLAAALSQAFGGEYRAFGWSGGATQRSREKAGETLRKMIREHLAKGDTVNLVGHSHGGNVIAHALQGLDPHEKVNDVMLLGTPHSVDGNGAWNDRAIARVGGIIQNVYSNNDTVQTFWARMRNMLDWGRRTRFGARTLKNPAQNIDVTDIPEGAGRSGIIGGIAEHSRMRLAETIEHAHSQRHLR